MKTWLCFKYVTYLIGWTYIILHIAAKNLDIFNEMLFYAMYGAPNAKVFAFVVFEFIAILYPIWIIGVAGMIREWKNDWQKEDLVTGGDS